MLTLQWADRKIYGLEQQSLKLARFLAGERFQEVELNEEVSTKKKESLCFEMKPSST